MDKSERPEDRCPVGYRILTGREIQVILNGRRLLGVLNALIV